MCNRNVTESVRYIGVYDTTLDLFESQYPVPDGVTYNSYLILDEKVAVMDTVDARATDEWFANLERELAGRQVDYLVVSHMEPDHAANVGAFMERYPQAKIVGNAKTFAMIRQFFGAGIDGRELEVKEGSVLELGAHSLTFAMAPMVHWPEVMVSYERSEKLLFSADAFGTFGAFDSDQPWEEEAARYFLNIVGKYGVQVQTLLKKAAAFDIETICPLHGPVLTGDLQRYIDKYLLWSSYAPEQHGVLVAFASIHGNTGKAAQELAGLLRERGEEHVEVIDLARTEKSLAVRKAFFYDRMVVAAASYDGGVFPCMEEFLLHLKSKNWQKRKVGMMENGTWAPTAGKAMRAILETMKAVEILEPAVSIRSVLNAQSREAMAALADAVRAAE